MPASKILGSVSLFLGFFFLLLGRRINNESIKAIKKDLANETTNSLQDKSVSPFKSAICMLAGIVFLNAGFLVIKSGF